MKRELIGEMEVSTSEHIDHKAAGAPISDVHTGTDAKGKEKARRQSRWRQSRWPWQSEGGSERAVKAKRTHRLPKP